MFASIRRWLFGPQLTPQVAAQHRRAADQIAATAQYLEVHQHQNRRGRRRKR